MRKKINPVYAVLIRGEKKKKRKKEKKRGLTCIISGTKNVEVQLQECICFVRFKPAVASITGTRSWV